MIHSKYFRKAILAGGLALSLAGFAAAQTANDTNQNPPQTGNAAGNRDDRGDRDDRGGMKSLGLSADQKAQLKSIRESAKSQRDAIKNDKSLTPEQQKQRLKDLHKSTRQKMEGVLTPEQREKMKDIRKSRRGHGRRRERG